MEKEARNRLEAVLAAYGADPARWPAADRERLATLIASGEGETWQAVDEARVMDALLGRASEPVPPAGAAERLVARAAASKLGSVQRDNVVELRRGVPDGQTGHRQSVPSGWVAVASALAASLLLGVYLGASGLADPFMPRLLTGNGGEITSAELDMVNLPQQVLIDEMEL